MHKYSCDIYIYICTGVHNLETNNEMAQLKITVVRMHQMSQTSKNYCLLPKRSADAELEN